MLTGIDVVLGGGALLATAEHLARPGRAASECDRACSSRPSLARRGRDRRGARAGASSRGCSTHVREGAALLSDPRRFLREAVTWQVGAWMARVAVAFVALHAFGLPASLLDAVLVVVVTGLAGVIPFLPGGVGAQQAMLVYALRKTASAASVVAFGVGMQLGVTLVDLTVGVIALLITFRTLALRGALRASRHPRSRAPRAAPRAARGRR